MKNYTLFLKITGILIVIVFVVFFAFLRFTYLPAMERAAEREIYLSGKAVCNAYSSAIMIGIQEQNDILLMQCVTSISKIPYVAYVSVISTSGIILSDTRATEIGKQVTSEKYLRALKYDYNFLYENKKEKEYLFSYPLLTPEDRQIIAVIFISFLQDPVVQIRKNVGKNILINSIIFTLIIIVPSLFLLYTHFAKPMNSLLNVLHSISLGSLGEKITGIEAQDQIKMVIDYVNKIIDKYYKKIQEQ